jgi:hypothetical protein
MHIAALRLLAQFTTEHLSRSERSPSRFGGGCFGLAAGTGGIFFTWAHRHAPAR